MLILDARGSQFGSQSRSAEGVSLNTIAALVTLEQVADRAAQILGGNVDSAKLAADVSASADTETGILTITAAADGGRRAERVADAFARGLRDYLDDQRRQSLQTQIRTLRGQLEGIPEEGSRGNNDDPLRLTLQSQISSLQSALATPLGLPIIERTDADRIEQSALTAPRSRASRMLLGALVGLLGGVVIALLLERFDQRITSWKVAEALFDEPLLAEIPKLRHRKSLAVVDRPTSLGADSFRLLASTVLHAVREQRRSASEGNGHSEHTITQTIAITSAIRSEGEEPDRSQPGGGVRRDRDRHDRRLSRSSIAHGPRTSGRTEPLGFRTRSPRGTVSKASVRVLQKTRAPNVSVIAGGSPSERPASILASEELRSLVRHAREEAEIVILDTPAILLSGDAIPPLQEADAVLFVARVGKTTIPAAERASETLARLGLRVVGYTLNGSRTAGSVWRRGSYRVVKDPSTQRLVTSAGDRAPKLTQETR